MGSGKCLAGKSDDLSENLSVTYSRSKPQGNSPFATEPIIQNANFV